MLSDSYRPLDSRVAILVSRTTKPKVLPLCRTGAYTLQTVALPTVLNTVERNTTLESMAASNSPTMSSGMTFPTTSSARSVITVDGRHCSATTYLPSPSCTSSSRSAKLNRRSPANRRQDDAATRGPRRRSRGALQGYVKNQPYPYHTQTHRRRRGKSHGQVRRL